MNTKSKQAQKAITDLEAKLKEETEINKIEDETKRLKNETNKVEMSILLLFI